MSGDVLEIEVVRVELLARIDRAQGLNRNHTYALALKKIPGSPLKCVLSTPYRS